MTIRPIELRDAEAVSRLSEQLGYPMAARTIEDRLGVILALPDHRALVIEVEGDVKGWIHMHVAHILESPASHVEIVGLVIDEGARGLGLGRALVDAAEQWTQAQGLGDLKVRSASRRTEAHQFYQHLGFDLVKTQMRFEKKLST